MISCNRYLSFLGKYFLSGCIERDARRDRQVQAVYIGRMLYPDRLSYLRIFGRKTRRLVTEYKGERFIDIRILKEGTAVQHKRIDIIIGEPAPIVVESLEHLNIDPCGCSHGSSYRLGVKVIYSRWHYSDISNAEARAASHDGTHIARIGRIDQHHMVAGLNFRLLLLYNSYYKAVLFLREDIKGFLLCLKGYLLILTDGLYLLDSLLGRELRVKDNTRYEIGSVV